MTDHATIVRRPRRGLRRAALPVLLLGVLATGAALAGPAAAVPDTWEDTDNPSVAVALLTLGGGALAVILVLALLTYLPSMMRGASGEGTMSFQEKTDWFGGPRRGVDEDAHEAQGTGGSGARW